MRRVSTVSHRATIDLALIVMLAPTFAFAGGTKNADAAFAAGHFDDAYAAYRDLAERTRTGRAWLFTGLSAFLRDDRDEARAALDREMAVDPGTHPGEIALLRSELASGGHSSEAAQMRALSSMRTYAATGLGSFAFGRATIANTPAEILPGALHRLPDGIAGVIGESLLSRYHCTADFPGDGFGLGLFRTRGDIGSGFFAHYVLTIDIGTRALTLAEPR